MSQPASILQFKAFSDFRIRDLSETDLKRIWFERCFGPRTVQTDTGDSVKIIFPGRWNRGAGPDFLNARFVFNGKEITGDVEIHKLPEDWYRHLHHINSAYNGVKLHFSLSAENPERIRNADGKLVPQLCIENVFSPPQLAVIADYRSGSSCISPVWENLDCRLEIRRIDTDSLDGYFIMLGKERLSAKAERFGRRIHSVGYEQTIYEGLFESAGYAVNKQPFLFLAALVNLKMLREILQWTAADERLLTAEALLLGTARLLPGQMPEMGDLDLDGSLRSQELEKKWRKMRHLLSDPIIERDSFSRRGQRPFSSPSRSIAGIANFIVDNFNNNLFNLFYNPFKTECTGSETYSDGIASLLNRKSPGFWSLRTGFSNESKRNSALFGREKTNRFIGNVLLPVFLHYAYCRREKELAEKISEYAGLLGAAHNTYTKFIFNQFGGNASKKMQLSFLVEQGIIAHYSENCAKGFCLDCPAARLK